MSGGRWSLFGAWVRVRCRRTALDSEQNAHIEQLVREEASSGPAWEQQVNAVQFSR